MGSCPLEWNEKYCKCVRTTIDDLVVLKDFLPAEWDHSALVHSLVDDTYIYIHTRTRFALNETLVVL